MARIRTIKPEFPQSESMGRVSRDARLLFIELWTICDDSGRTRGNSRMLASLLFPYDDDAPSLIDGWLEELERENCLVRYKVDGASYVEICNWLNHQKIDKPTPSKIPAFDESSRILASPREIPSVDVDQGEEWSRPISVAKATGDASPKITDPDEIIFGYGVPLLVTAGTPEKNARSFLGGLRKSHGDDALIDKLRECVREKPIQPLEWLAKSLPPVGYSKQGKKPAPENFQTKDYGAGGAL